MLVYDIILSPSKGSAPATAAAAVAVAVAVGLVLQGQTLKGTPQTRKRATTR